MQLTHPYHIVSPAPWPFYLSISLLSFFVNLVGSNSLLVSLLALSLCLHGWLSDLHSEFSYIGKSTSLVKTNALLRVLHVLNPQR